MGVSLCHIKYAYRWNSHRILSSHELCKAPGVYKTVPKAKHLLGLPPWLSGLMHCATATQLKFTLRQCDFNLPSHHDRNKPIEGHLFIGHQSNSRLPTQQAWDQPMKSRFVYFPPIRFELFNMVGKWLPIWFHCFINKTNAMRFLVLPSAVVRFRK